MTSCAYDETYQCDRSDCARRGCQKPVDKESLSPAARSKTQAKRFAAQATPAQTPRTEALHKKFLSEWNKFAYASYEDLQHSARNTDEAMDLARTLERDNAALQKIALSDAECRASLAGDLAKAERELAEAQKTVAEYFGTIHYQETEIESLIHDIERHVAIASTEVQRAETAEAALSAALADKERAEKDAERYRQAVKMNDGAYFDMRYFKHSKKKDGEESKWHWLPHYEMHTFFDAAIDRARTEKEAP